METITVTTNDLKSDYDILGIVSLYHSSTYTKTIYGSNLSADDTVQAMIKKLKEKTQTLGGDAIIGFRIEMHSAPGAMGVAELYNAFGTAVKIKQS